MNFLQGKDDNVVDKFLFIPFLQRGVFYSLTGEVLGYFGAKMRTIKQLPVILVLLSLSSGCASIPFQKTDYIPLDNIDPWTIVEQFRNSSPENFSLVNTIVFKYKRRKILAIGFINAHVREKTFNVACINPMGVKLFELSGDEAGINTHFMMHEFTKKGNFASTIGGDIKCIYFDLIPSFEAVIKKERSQIRFIQQSGVGMLEYVFAGHEGFLVEKNYYEDNTLNWRVSYYEYQQKDGKAYPGGIFFNNHKYGYSLTVRLKEIRM